MARIALGLMLGAGILIVAAWLMGVRQDDLLAALAGAGWWISPVCVAALFFLFALGALRWNRTFQPLIGNTFWQGYWAMAFTYALNAILPAHSGDLVRVNIIAVRSGKPRATILGGEIMDKGMDFCGPFPTTLLLVLLGQAPGWLVNSVLLIAAGACAIALFIFGSRSRPPVGAGLFSRSILNIRNAYLGRGARELLVTAIVFGSLPWVGEAAMIFFIANGFGISLTPDGAFCVLVALKVGMAVPTPGGIGSVEAAGAAALVFFGAPPASALALMLIYRASQLAAGSLVGAVCLALPVRIGRPQVETS